MLQSLGIKMRYYCLGKIPVRCKSFKPIENKLDVNHPSLDSAKDLSESVRKAFEEVLKIIGGGGGAKSIHRHTVINKKLLVRDRLKLLFDANSPFLEIGTFAGMAMDYGTIPTGGSVAGVGKINNQYCMVSANDATVKGGTFFPITITKLVRVQQLAFVNKLPCIYLVDSGGGFLPLQAEVFPDRDHGGRTFYNEAVMSANGIPQIAVVCGSSTAGGAYCPTMAEEAIIVKHSGVLFLAGPPLVKAATGETVSEEELGGADVHCRISGCTDYYAETEEEAFDMCRESVLALNLPDIFPSPDFPEPLHPSEELDIISGKKEITKDDMYHILCRILDNSMFKEFKKHFGVNLITGFGYLHGKLIGLIVNCGNLLSPDALKGAHFIRICEKRNIPLVFLQNSGNSCIEKEPLVEAIEIKDRAKMISSHCSAKVPKITINVGGCFGDDNFTMCGWSFQPNFYFSWPLAHSSSIKTHATHAQFSERNILEKIKDNVERNVLEKLFDNPSSAFFRSSRMLQDAIILPAQTREVLALCLDVVSTIGARSNNIKSRSAILRM